MVKIIVCKTTEIVSGQMKKVSFDGKEIVVCNVDGNYFAIDDTCTHSGASLSEGKLEDSTITCDWHGAQFECKTGKLVKFPAEIANLKSYNVIVESDDVIVET
ncbi:3-phenylpropionate-cinnamic acid dioxygenase ferredoxin subunit protein [Marine Group I thaumarchaeote SCGC AAA799-D07]|nr:3-phenylpropionate-cinnamic acid dioxygenase ferredoxin subunit protein [Marine Group I thaumarchaeote SCGC AAA799-D07]